MHRTWLLLAALIVVLAVCCCSVVQSKGAKNRFYPHTFVAGHWTVRDVTSPALSMLSSPESEIVFRRAGAFDGVVLGSWLLRLDSRYDGGCDNSGGPRNASSYPPCPKYDAAHDILTAMPFSDDDGEHAEAPMAPSGASELVIPLKIEADNTLMGGVLQLGRDATDDESAEEEKSDTSSKTTESSSVEELTASLPYVFYQSPSDFYHFKTHSGRCPSLSSLMEKEKELIGSKKAANPMAAVSRLLRAATATLDDDIQAEKKEEGGAGLERAVKSAAADVADSSTSSGAASDVDKQSPNDKKKESVLRWCHSYQVTVLEDEAMLLTLTFPRQTDADDTNKMDSRTFILKKRTVNSNNWSWKTTVGTVSLLLIVALIKFGPRFYFKYKGIDTDLLRNKKKLAERIAKLSPEQRAKLMAEQRRLAQEQEDEICKKQEEEQRELMRGRTAK